MDTSRTGPIAAWLRRLVLPLLRGPLTRLIAWNRIYERLQGPFILAQHRAESYLVRADDTPIGQDLYAIGHFEFHKFERALALVDALELLQGDRRQTVLIDVGANVGPTCIPALKRGHVGRCVALEPDPVSFRLLRINALLNEVEDRLECHQLAAGNDERSVRLVRHASNHGDQRVTISNESGAGLGVDMTRLDAFAAGLDLTNTILWLDIQGFEGHALDGAPTFIDARVPIVIELEVPLLEASDGLELLLGVLEGSDYTHFYDLAHEAPRPVPLCRSALLDLVDDLRARQQLTDLLIVCAPALAGTGDGSIGP